MNVTTRAQFTFEKDAMGISQLIDDINNAAQMLSSFDNGSHKSHSSTTLSDQIKLLAAARTLITALEVPQKTVLEISKGPAGHAALRTALMLRVFERWVDGEVHTAARIAEQTGAEEVLIVRIMRVLVTIGIFNETGENTYEHNTLSHTLNDPTFRTLITGMSSTAGLTMAKLPEYLVSRSFRNPSDHENSLFHYALGTNLNMFEWLKTQPEQLAVFSAYNTAATEIQGRSFQARISSLFPQEDASERYHVSESHVLFVDIGAGRGQALAEVRGDRPDLTGRIVAQDLPEVIAGREKLEGVENMIHDFFKPQPVQGASVYYFCHIMHDWPDVVCRHILTNTIPALEPDHSRIVIVDQVLPNTGATAFAAFMDLSMMTFGGMERTERMWRDLLEGVGLTVLRIEQPKAESLSRDGTIEAIYRR